MLYCPKCRRTYQEGTVRFCTNDGGRLLPAPTSTPSAGKPAGVFSNLLGRQENKNSMDEKLGDSPRFSKVEAPNFQTTSKNPIFKQELKPTFTNDDDLLDIPLNRPTGRLIKPNEIASSNAPLGDRQKFPTGRLAISWDNPNVLLGQTVKGRYYVEEKLGQDDLSVTFLATDKILMGKKVVVKVLMDNESGSEKRFSEARVTLSHLNHPNIANVFDSGELLEGKIFIISEYVEGKSLHTSLKESGNVINPLRTGRIIRQASYALSEAHQNGVLHRGLTPERIILGLSDIGSEQVKVSDFGLAGTVIPKNLLKTAYCSPEQLEGKQLSFAGDTYSLAVVAYQMLTGRLPFNTTSIKEQIDSQKKGLTVLPTNIKIDLPTEVDNIFRKALSFESTARYPKSRDFGDALFNALTAPTLDRKVVESNKDEIALPSSNVSTIVSGVSLNALSKNISADEPESKVDEYLHISPQIADKKDIFAFDNETELETEKSSQIQATEELAWEKRSPEPVKIVSLSKLLGLFLLFLLLLSGLFFAWQYYLNNQDKLGVETPNITKNPDSQSQNAGANSEILPDDPYKVLPKPRTISQPVGFNYFGNTQANLPQNLITNYRNFEVYYPETWRKCDWQKESVCKPGKVGDNFVEFTKINEAQKLVERAVIGVYQSKGMFADDVANFPKLVDSANKELASSKDLKDYKKLSEGEIIINGDKPAYQMQFEGTYQGNKIYGKTFYFPPQRPGKKTGLRLTMLATSLSDSVKSIDDLGTKGELAEILRTFEPGDPASVNY